MATQSTEERRQELAALITGRSDQQIVDGVKTRGTERVLDQVFTGMCEAFMPVKAGNQRVVLQYDIGVGEETYTYQLKIADGRCEMVKGAAGPARTTLVAEVPNFLRLITGKLGGMMAVVTGKLKVKGDLLFAQTMQSWFRQG